MKIDLGNSLTIIDTEKEEIVITEIDYGNGKKITRISIEEKITDCADPYGE